MSHWQKPIDNIHNRRNLAGYLKAGCPKIDPNGAVVQSTLPDSEELTQLILGDDYLPAEKTAEVFGFQYSDAQLEHLAETLPTDLETLLLLKTYGCMLAAGPNEDTNYLGVKTLIGTRPDELNKYWYVREKEKFARNEFVKAARWMIIRKTPVENSTNKTWEEQFSLIPNGYGVPNAAEMVYAMEAYLKVRGVRLFKFGISLTHVRTSSVLADGDHLFVGGVTHRNGIHVGRCPDSYRGNDLGITYVQDLT